LKRKGAYCTVCWVPDPRRGEERKMILREGERKGRKGTTNLPHGILGGEKESTVGSPPEQFFNILQKKKRGRHGKKKEALSFRKRKKKKSLPCFHEKREKSQKKW